MTSDEPKPISLEDGDRKELLRIARVTLKEWLGTGHLPPGVPHRAALLTHAAAFVTVYVDGDLRGCIGHTAPETPLYRTIADLTVCAAARDPRFEPLRIEELSAVKITISVLSACRTVTDPKEIEVGKHGLIISRGPYRGLLLPQVPVEHGWGREEFLDHTCLKAQLSEGDWREAGTKIELFTADVFSE